MKTWILAALMMGASAHAGDLMGGNSGGGGTLAPPQPMTESELASFILAKVPKFARMYFNFVGLPYLVPDQTIPRWVQADPNPDEDLSRSTYQKVFLTQPTLLEKMESTKLTIQTKPCFDPVTGEERDASAFADKNEICFNVAGLLKNLPSRSLRSEVLSLAIHEYSHLNGTSEPEADFIEGWARQTIAVDGVIFARIEREWETIESEWEALVTVRSLISEVDTLSSVALSFRVGEAAFDAKARLSRAMDLIFYTGLSGWTREQVAKAVYLAIKLENLVTFKCALPEIKAAPERQGCTATDGTPEQDVYSIADFEKYSKFKFLISVEGQFRYLKKGDRAALKAELTETAALLRQLFKDLPEDSK